MLPDWIFGNRRISTVYKGWIVIPLFIANAVLGSDLKESEEPIQAIPIENVLNVDKVELGKKLFFEKRLSHDNSVACASCHNLSASGADQKARSVGINQQTGNINAPTVFNSSYNFVQFWDGRATNLEDQIDGPVNSSVEMGSNWPEIVSKLSSDESYRFNFEKLYSGQITAISIKSAIATFERALSTPRARFDLYLKGDKSAVSELEIRGYRNFKSLGCIACHQGVNVGGNMFQVMGVMRDYFKDRGGENEADQGRYNFTRLEADRHFFKVPSLRNVELTAPYFHDGSAKTLVDAIRIMATYQLGRKISYDEVLSIEAFLKTLTGYPDKNLTQPPMSNVDSGKVR